jgi:uncharacterized protein YndB with AHSA1/START domain
MTASPAARVEMLIRKPAAEVFAAFVEPQQLTRFWLSHASAPLVAGTRVRWDFMVEGASAELDVKAIEPAKRILIEWVGGGTVEWTFTEAAGKETVVTVIDRGFRGSLDEQIATAVDSTEGFTIVLCDLKVLLESGTSPGLVKDKAALLMAGGGK